MKTSFAVVLILLVVSFAPVFGQSPHAGSVNDAPSVVLPVGLNGYCPVTSKANVEKFLEENPGGSPTTLDVFKQLGKAEFSLLYDGVIYYFADFESRKAFEANPFPYVPALGGNCVTCFVEEKRMVLGSKNFFSFDKDRRRFYLFPNPDTRTFFANNFRKYIDIDLRFGGQLVEFDKTKFVVTDEQGDINSEHVWHYRGKVYRFKDAPSLTEFKKNPTIEVAAPNKTR